MIPDDILSGMRGRFGYSQLTNLQAATFDFDEAGRHLRFDFFFAGASEDVDFDELESGLLGELIADVWSGVDTVGFAVFFDEPSARLASLEPSRLYPPIYVKSSDG
jgi:hypothetical protein